MKIKKRKARKKRRWESKGKINEDERKREIKRKK